MPGKGDYANDNALGKYFPGSKEYKAWDEGWRYRFTGDGVTNPKTNNPISETQKPAEWAAWNYGYDQAAANVAGQQRMPFNTGAAPVP